MVRKKELRSFSHRDLFLISFVIFALVGSFILLQEISSPFGLLGISGYNVAHIQADCGGATACQCNDALTSSRTLTATDNLTGCFLGRALTINVSHVVLDCDGRVIASNGTGTLGVVVDTGVTNVTIRNCNIDNFSQQSLRFLNSSGNNSVVENVNFSNFNGSTSRALDVGNYIVNLSILHNIFKANSSTADAIVFGGVRNVSIRNNTFELLDIALQFGSAGVETANLSVSGNRYVSPAIGILLLSGMYSNNTFRDENVSGTSFAYDIRESDGNFTNKFVNTSVALRSNKIIRFGSANTVFVMAQNESFAYYLSTSFGNGVLTNNRDVLLWSSRNVSFTDNYSIPPSPVNYTFLTNFTTGGVLIYVNGNLNRSAVFNPQGIVSALLYPLSGLNNISFGVDVVNPGLTLNSPTLDSSLGSGTTETLLNISTNENASCRFDTSNVVYASMANAFNSSSNFTHVGVARSLSGGGSYTYYVRCQDLVTNTVATTLNFSVSTAPVSSSSSSSSSEGKSSKSKSSAPAAEEETEIVSPVASQQEEEAIVEEEAALDEEKENRGSDVAQSSELKTEEESSTRGYAPLFSPENLTSVTLWFVLLVLLFLFVFIFGFLRHYPKQESSVQKAVELKTMKDYYASFVLLKRMCQSSSDEQRKQARASLDSLQKVFAESWLQTQTKIVYRTNNLAQIQQSLVSIAISLPVYTSSSLVSLRRDSSALQCLQTLFGTKDGIDTIIQTLEFISGKSSDKILFVSPSLESRMKYPERIAGFDYDKGYFRISTCGLK